jgi:hypothetical protein
MKIVDLGLYVSVAMNFQLKDIDGVDDRSARNEFQKDRHYWT